MDILNLLKIITAIITVIFAFIAAFIELHKDPKFWLNRWFALFFSSFALGFLFYTIYHIITSNSSVIIPIMITGQILLNFSVICLLMTVFILEHSEEIAMTSKYLGIAMVLFVISIFGYFIWTPTLNMERYKQGIVDTETPLGWFIFVNILRLIIGIYALFKFAQLAVKTEGKSKQRVFWFFMGCFFIITGTLLNLFGGILGSILIEILGLVAFDIGTIMIVKGFLIVEQ